MRGFLKVLGVLTCVVLLPSAVFAQSAGATIAGVVKDTSGAVLPGVTVQVASPALIERVRETVSDGSGQYRFVDLRPGTYSVTATLTGFNTFKRDNVEVSGTGTISIPAEMKVGAIEETVTVSGETPVVDLQSTTKERVMSKEVLDALPTGRMYYTLGVLVPGVNSSSRDVGGALGDTMGSLSAHGGAGGDQRVMQNGLNVMTLQTGTGSIGGMVPNTNGAQEVAIDTSAASAERQTGGVSVNFIPRDGGNTVRGSVFATAAYENQQASNFTQDLQDAGLTRVNKYKQNWDFNPGIGGPILKDKVWYYYTYRNNGAFNYAAGMAYNQNEFLPVPPGPNPNANGGYVYSANNNRPALSQHGDWWDSQLRLTWQMDPKNKFAGTWDQQYYCRCPNGVSSTTSPEAANDRRFPTQQLLHGEWWSPLTSKILIEFVALHRTERWGNMDLRPTDQGGSLNITPAQYALYPTLIGVNVTNGTIPGLNFHGPSGTFNNTWVPNYTYRYAVSYITGAHAFKVGGQDSFGYRATTTYIPTLDTLNRPVRYRFDDPSPTSENQVTVYQTPYSVKEDQNHDLGLFVQDRWTMNRLTLNGGLRFDWYNGSIPPQVLGGSTLGRPQTNFPEILDVVNWKDWTPRAGAAYDLRGDGKTAVKVTLNKYVGGQTVGGLTGNANPIGKLTNNVNRTWTDTNNDLIVNCNLSNNAAQVGVDSCGTANAAFGSVLVPGATADNPAGLTDFNVRRGWGVRNYNWEFSTGVQRELMPRVSLDVSYFRRWFGNFTATDNLALNSAGSVLAPVSANGNDFRYFDIITPIDSRLPGGGGQRVNGFTEFTSAGAATATANNQSVFTDCIVRDSSGNCVDANRIQHWNGVDVNVNARLQNGLLLQGGTSTGRQTENTCGVAAALPETLGSNPLSWCEQTEPWLTQVKAVAAYTLPRYAGLPSTMAMVLQNIQIAGTFQSLPGSELSASYSMSSSGTNPKGNELDSNSPQSRTFGLPGGLVNGTTKTVNLIAPVSLYDKRMNQLDLRVGRILRFGRTRTTLNLDVYNVFNDNTILNRNSTLSRNLSGTFAAPVDTTNGVDAFGNALVNGANNQARQGALVGNGTINASNTLWVPSTILQARFYKISATFDF